jgi:hypothetical protein
MGDYDALHRAERDRLEAFAAAFEDVDPLGYERFAGSTADDDEVESARSSALAAIATDARRKAVERAVRSFRAASEEALSRRLPAPQMLFAGFGQAPRAEDRVRFQQTLERAVVATIVWDELTDEERDVLAGPWAQLLQQALGGHHG